VRLMGSSGEAKALLEGVQRTVVTQQTAAYLAQ
jgi:hypothetical protein